MLSRYFKFNEKLKVNPVWAKLSQLQSQSDIRSRYISALKFADIHTIDPLIEFMFLGI